MTLGMWLICWVFIDFIAIFLTLTSCFMQVWTCL